MSKFLIELQFVVLADIILAARTLDVYLAISIREVHFLVKRVIVGNVDILLLALARRKRTRDGHYRYLGFHLVINEVSCIIIQIIVIVHFGTLSNISNITDVVTNNFILRKRRCIASYRIKVYRAVRATNRYRNRSRLLEVVSRYILFGARENTVQIY